jgi:hypothetical protein
VAIALIVFGVLVAGIGVWWISNDDPLVQGSVGYGAPPTASTRVQEVDAFGVKGLVFQIPARRAMVFRYSFSILNDGAVPIDIEAIGWQGGGPMQTAAVAFNSDIDRGGSTDAGAEPFQPFRLAPGADAGIEMQVTLGPDVCLDRGGSLTAYQEPVTFRVLGITRHESVTTGVQLEITGTPETSTDC